VVQEDVEAVEFKAAVLVLCVSIHGVDYVGLLANESLNEDVLDAVHG